MKDNFENAVLHYNAEFAKKAADEIAVRTGVPFDTEKNAFRPTLFGKSSAVFHPSAVFAPPNLPLKERVLLLRYLNYANPTPHKGGFLSYAQFPWGEVYIRQFTGRVLMRAARKFAKDFNAVQSFNAALEKAAQHGFPVKKIEGKGDAAFCVEVVSGFFMEVFLYAGDDEFPASCQMLFSDNFESAFSAEDMAVAGELLIDALQSVTTAR